MTNPMLAELDAVVRLIERHDFLERLDAHDAATQLSLGFTQMAARFFRTHHATLADMAKRLEAAERDAARYRWLRLANFDEAMRALFAEETRTVRNAKKMLDAAIDVAMQETGR